MTSEAMVEVVERHLVISMIDGALVGLRPEMSAAEALTTLRGLYEKLPAAHRIAAEARQHGDGGRELSPDLQARVDQAVIWINDMIRLRSTRSPAIVQMQEWRDLITDLAALSRQRVDDRMREALRVVVDAIGDWSRPTNANGMIPAGEDHPLCKAARIGRAALEGADHG